VLCVKCTEYSMESIPYMLSAYVLCCLYLYVSLLYIRKNLTSVFLAYPRNLVIVSSLTGRVKVTGVPSWQVVKSPHSVVWAPDVTMTSNTSDFFSNCEILWSCWPLWQNRSGISIVVTQVTKSNFLTMSTSKKVFRSHCDNDRQLEIEIWPHKPEVLISLELW